MIQIKLNYNNYNHFQSHFSYSLISTSFLPFSTMDFSDKLCNQVTSYLASPASASNSLNGHTINANANVNMKREEVLKDLCVELQEQVSSGGSSAAWLEVAFHRALNVFLVFHKLLIGVYWIGLNLKDVLPLSNRLRKIV